MRRHVAGPGGVSFECDTSWLKRPGAIALHEDLPLTPGAFMPPRRGDAMAIERNREQVFRRMVFNLLMDNTDDHEKNHALLQQVHDLALSPAYDKVATGQALRYQSMRVDRDGHASTVTNALSEAGRFLCLPTALARL